MLSPNVELQEVVKMHPTFAPGTPAAAPTGSGAWVSMKGYQRARIDIFVDNGNTVTGTAVTVEQATAVAGTGGKAVAFTKAYRNIDVAASSVQAEFAVTSNTFTTDATNAKNLHYTIEIATNQLDAAGGFDCIRVKLADGANMVACAVVTLYPAKYAKQAQPDVLVD